VRAELQRFLASLWCVAALPLSAQEATQVLPAQSGLRLSSYLLGLSSGAPHEDDGLGLMWTTAEEKQRQQHLHHQLQMQLDQWRDAGRLKLPSHQAMSRLLAALPPTGRVRTAAANPQWLQANPQRDPVLQAGDGVRLPRQRPQAVRVLNERGQVCELPFRTGLLAVDYVQACTEMDSADWAWVTQPDGRVQQAGLRAWNPSRQDSPAPGAWIWAPTPEAMPGLPASFHQQWAEWLSTQGVSTAWPLEQLGQVSWATRPHAPAEDTFERRGRQLNPQPSASNWGVVGLLQTPTARMRTEGHFSLNLSWMYPYQSFNVMFQPFSWMEMGFRYVDVKNRLYGSQAYSGSESYKDKSLDLKLRVMREDATRPELAVGWRDMAGTGLYSSEYIVASKRAGRVDFSAGLAWGYLGGRANLPNPFSTVLGHRYDTRVNNTGEGGNFSVSNWFRGRPALMGGIEYQSPWNLVFKAEWDGNHYQHEPQSNNLPQTSPINWGVVYRWRPGVDVGVGFERGQRVTAGLTLYTDMSGLNMPKVTDPTLPMVRKEPPRGEPHWGQTAADLNRHTLWQVSQLYRRPDTLVVQAEKSYNTYAEDRLNKAAAVLHRDAPAEVTQFEVQHVNLGQVLAVETVQRDDWVQRQLQPSRTQTEVLPTPVTYTPSTEPVTPLLAKHETRVRMDPGLDYQQIIGGPNGYLYQFSATGSLSLELPWNLKTDGLLRMRIQDNYDQFTTPGWSYMQPVRTQVREYLRTSRVTLDNLSLSKSERLSENWYASAYAGLFESMFGGVGGEVLYRQPGSPWAVGVDVNRVRQRAFAQDFHFQDYQVNTGHVTGYWITPIEGVHASLNFGQYLAGDRGATLTLTKVFQNGSTISAYASKTNVPAAVFGEGSFDKGIVWTIPFDAFLTSSSRLTAGFSWKPLLRDGAAKVQRPVSLYNETVWLSPKAKSYRRAPPDNDTVPPDDRVEPPLRP
jgi:hypothetical protein